MMNEFYILVRMHVFLCFVFFSILTIANDNDGADWPRNELRIRTKFVVAVDDDDDDDRPPPPTPKFESFNESVQTKKTVNEKINYYIIINKNQQ